MKKANKISILGAGNVGATIAYTLTLEGLASEIVLVDINKNKAKGESLDIIQCTALCPSVNIYSGEYSDIEGSDIVIVTLGCARKPGQSRIDLAQGNVNIIKSVMPQAVKYAPNAIYVAVSNPVDIITYTTLKVTGLPENHVFGSGTLLDSARLREMIAKHVNVNPKNIHAYVLGEHGDSSMVPWSLTSIGGIPMDIYMNSIRKKDTRSAALDHDKIVDDVHKSGGEIIRLKGATFYAIAVSATKICRNILRDTNSVMPLSGLLHGEYGFDGICMSVPFILNRDGIVNSVTPPLTDAEMEKLKASASLLKDTIAKLTI
ncbi:MAG: L-lactate dehydrogenase [Oscillospiraceae bacterium]|jgi:L-lactate dehydrogenase|nr:L-lactate dehydrogenase [Oscillospiraceae bacterium]MCI1991472.1 L-lactate dehydrogenase [Oscillospiraceae bacterium]MCI2035397.1 L-lactate dehydrogenase [Oscillospiraceae bacterium]